MGVEDFSTACKSGDLTYVREAGNVNQRYTAKIQIVQSSFTGEEFKKIGHKEESNDGTRTNQTY